MENKRSVNYDFIRVLMSLWVICVHVPNPGRITDVDILNHAYNIFMLSSVSIFFMLSGKFALKKTCNTKKEYKDYYVNKFATIIIPFVIMTALIAIRRWYYLGGNDSLFDVFVEEFTWTNTKTHMWFMCVLVGYLLSAPFLAKMVYALKDFELNIIFLVGLLWNFISIYLFEDFDTNFPFQGWLFSGWLFIFFLGYFAECGIKEDKVKIVYIIGIIGYVFSVLGRTFIPGFTGEADLSVGAIMFALACFLFLERHTDFKNEYVKKTIFFLARYSFLSYMIHAEFLGIFSGIIHPQGRVRDHLLCVVLVFTVSYATSILIDFILIRPLQKLWYYLLKYTI